MFLLNLRVEYGKTPLTNFFAVSFLHEKNSAFTGCFKDFELTSGKEGR
jgi:hypothetical protein